MPSVADNLNATIAGYVAALAADADNPQPTVTIDGKTVDRNVWREGLQRQIVALQKTVNGLNTYCVVSRKVL